MRLLSTLLVAAWFGRAQAALYETRFEGTTWDDTNWRLINTNLVQGQYQSRLSLANGYLGINVAAAGPFFEVDADNGYVGWPEFNRRQTFATVSGFWDSQNNTAVDGNFPWLLQYGGESVISGVPHWSGLLVITDSGQVLNASVSAEQISSYSAILDIGAGLHTWRYTWTPEGEPPIDIEYSMYVHKLYVNQATVQLQVTPSRSTNLTVVDVMDGDCAVRSTFTDKAFNAETGQIWTAVNPVGIDNVTAYIYSTLVSDCRETRHFQFSNEHYIGGNGSSIAQALNVTLPAGQTGTFTKYIGGASSDAFEDPQGVARQASWVGAGMGYSGGLASHIEEWQSIMTQDSVDDFSVNGTLPDDDNIVELQVLAVTNPFYLLSATVSENAIAAASNNTELNTNSISVGGLGSDAYAGLIFWDADVWMGPGLVVSHPFAAQQISNFRAKQQGQARNNVKTAYQSSQNKTGQFTGGAVYSWTSGRFGNCTSTGPCFDYQYHLNGEIGLQMFNYWAATNDQEMWNTSYFSVYNDVAYFYGELLTFNSSTGKYDLLNATDPDEYANFIDNPGYTLPLIQTHLNETNKIRGRSGTTLNATWSSISPKINIPIDKDVGIITEYEGMNGSVLIKQADVTLVDDLIEFPNPYSLGDLEFYSNAQSPDGPAMTYSSYAIVSNKVSPSGCSAYTYSIWGGQPYNRGPWFQFSEQLIDDPEENGGTHPAYPFLTGMGGANRITVFGYLGLRLELDSLNIDPQLPPQVKALDYRTIFWQGHAINATSNQTHTVIRRVSSRNLRTANSTYDDASIPISIGYTSQSYSLPVNGSVTITNRRQSFNLTVPGNLAQCQRVLSNEATVPGQFALAAVDGAISTKWQPASPNTTASVTVDLSAQPIQRVTGFRFDWAQAPPESYTVRFSNATNLTAAAAEAVASGSGSSNNNTTATSSTNVTISHPYDAEEQLVVRQYTSNTTNVTLAAPVWSGRFATLSIAGTQVGDRSQGATVAEWVIIGENATSSDGGSGSSTAAAARRSAARAYTHRSRREAARLEPLWRW